MFRCGSLISHNDRMFKHAAGAHHNRRDEEEINRGDSSLGLVWPARPHKRLPGAVLSCANAVSSSGLAAQGRSLHNCRSILIYNSLDLRSIASLTSTRK